MWQERQGSHEMGLELVGARSLMPWALSILLVKRGDLTSKPNLKFPRLVKFTFDTVTSELLHHDIPSETGTGDLAIYRYPFSMH